MYTDEFDVVVIGGGHAGVEAAWACANLFESSGEGTVALITIDPTKVGVMSCNPAIGGLAKGQLVREIDALHGLMGRATDATGIQFKILNATKGPAVHGPRAQSDKHAYAECVQEMVASRREIRVIAGSVERFIVEGGRIAGVVMESGAHVSARAVVLTTGTFMRGLMHTGESKTPGGRFGESAAVGISGELVRLGFELGRLKTGTPPRLKRSTIRWDDLEPARGDAKPVPFSDLSARAPSDGAMGAFPVLEQVECRQTSTGRESHRVIRENLHRAPMYSGQIESAGPRYCPSIEDKVVRFAERESHGVFLEPESLRDDWIYCNGISTSLPRDVQDAIVRSMPGCEGAQVYRYGYAVEYDMVPPHQIDASGMSKRVEGLFLAGQINGTSGYEEAAAQGLVAGLNAVRYVRGEAMHTFGRDEGYIGVLMDDLVTKTPVEPYRMFTSRAEHRLVLRSDNSAERLTAWADEAGLLSGASGEKRRARFQERRGATAELEQVIDASREGDVPMDRVIRQASFEVTGLARWVREKDGALAARCERVGVIEHVFAERRYAPYIVRQGAEIKRHALMEHRVIPASLDHTLLVSMRTEARAALARFRPRTFGQAGRLEGITPADLTLLAVLVGQHGARRGGGEVRE